MPRRAFLPLAVTPLLVTKHHWAASSVYPGTAHDYWWI